MSDKIKLVQITEEIWINPYHVTAVIKDSKQGGTIINTTEGVHPEVACGFYRTNKPCEEIIKLLTQ
jgi:hypothetical protein